MKGFKIIKIPASVHSQLKLYCAKPDTKPMWWIAGMGVQNEIKKLKEESAKDKISSKIKSGKK